MTTTHMSVNLDPSGTHELRHVRFSDGKLTPSCKCGWYSPNRQHVEFERHMRRVLQQRASISQEVTS